MTDVITKLTLRGLRSHPLRFFLAAFAVLLGVSFVSGAFVLSDSLRKTFDGVFTQINKGIDVQVRSKVAFGDQAQAIRDPVPAQVLDAVRRIDGVALANGTLFRNAPLLDKAGKAIKTTGAPTAGVDFGGETPLSGTKLLAGRAPKGDGEAVIDGVTADRNHFKVGDQVTAALDQGKRTFTLVGLIGQGDQRGFAGATIVGFDPAVASALLDTGGTYDSIDIAAAKGVSQTELIQRVSAALPGNLEAITGKQVRDEATTAIGKIFTIFGSVLLGFAAVALFVSTFIINNTFRIIVGQRVRELALLRAVGADAKQVRRLVVVEALLVGVLASLLGLLAGVGVAKGLVALFNAGGAGFPDSDTVLKPRTIVIALTVGIGVTLLSSLAPALRAGRIPPVAAMRPELGYEARGSRRRFMVGLVVTVLGGILLGIGLFGRPGGTVGIIGLSAVGAIALFLGVASLSATVASRASLLIGAPFARLFRVPGELARQNAARAPRRTSATASALMIGLALVSSFSVVGASVKASFDKTLSRAVTADYFISDDNFQGFTPDLTAKIAAIPQMEVASALRFGQMQVEGDGKPVAAGDPATLGRLVNIGVKEGKLEDLAKGGLFVQTDPVRDLKLKVGDVVAVTWPNGTTGQLPVVGIFSDASVLNANWLVSLDTLSKASPLAPPRDMFVAAKLKNTADPATARAAIDAIAVDYPEVRIEDQAEFRKRQLGQINQSLVVVNGMLFLAVVIALLGIANTLALSVFERTRELGLLRAVGMSRLQLRRMVRWEAVIVALFGALLGVVIGTPLGAALSTALPKTFVSGVTVPAGQLLSLLLIALVAGIVAAIFPAWRASRMDVLQAIGSE